MRTDEECVEYARECVRARRAERRSGNPRPTSQHGARVDGGRYGWNEAR